MSTPLTKPPAVGQIIDTPKGRSAVIRVTENARLYRVAYANGEIGIIQKRSTNA